MSKLHVKYIRRLSFCLLAIFFFVVAGTVSSADEVDTSQTTSEPKATMIFTGSDANASVLRNDKTEDWQGYGSSAENAEDGTLDISYCNYKVSPNGRNYTAKIMFSSANQVTNADKYVRVLYSATMSTDSNQSKKLYIENDASNSDSVTLVSNLQDTNDEFVLSDVGTLNETATKADGTSTDGCIARFANGNHCSLTSDASSTDNVFKIKRVFFFDSQEAAQNFVYVEPEPVDTTPKATMIFTGSGTNASVLRNDLTADWKGYGSSVENEEDGTLDISYCNYKVSPNGRNYTAKIKFNSANQVTTSDKYVRVLYSAVMPTDTDQSKKLYIENDASNSDSVTLVSNLQDTNGEFVLSDVGTLNETATNANGETASCITRFANGAHCSLTSDASSMDNVIKIKRVFFFDSQEAAQSFVYAEPEPVDTTPKATMIFIGSGTNASVLRNDLTGDWQGFGSSVENEEDGTLDISYCGYKVSPNGRYYTAKIKFSSANQVTTSDKYVRVLYSAAMPTDSNQSKKLYIENDASNTDTVTLVSNLKDTNGEFVLSDVGTLNETATNANGEIAGCIARFANGAHCSLTSDASSQDNVFKIKRVFFFDSQEAAQNFVYVEPEPVDTTPKGMMIFTGSNENSSVLRKDGTADWVGYGKNEENEEDGTLDISYYKYKVTPNGRYYTAKIKFNSANQVTTSDKYVRVLYSATMPADSNQSKKLYIENDASNTDTVTLVSNLKDTNGEFVLSDVGALNENATKADGTSTAGSIVRFVNGSHCSLSSDAPSQDNVFKIKRVFFFDSLEAAEQFVYIPPVPTTLTIAENPIANYKIVIGEDTPNIVAIAADNVRKHIKSLTGTNLTIVTDDTAVSEYEILVGASNREASTSIFDDDNTSQYGRYAVVVSGNKLVVVAENAYDINRAVNKLEELMPIVESTVPSSIGLTADNTNFITDLTEDTTALLPVTHFMSAGWDVITNVETPEVFEDDFSADDGYFTEESNAQNWNISNGVLASNGQDNTLTYLHVYEMNVIMETKWKYTGTPSNDAQAGLMLRYTAEDSWIKAGYDFEDNVWYIESREGNDFYVKRHGSKSATLTADTWYTLNFTMNDKNAKLLVDGTEVLSVTIDEQHTPGRIAYYADGVSVAVDDADITLLSGQGSIIQNVVHTLLIPNEYSEGGTVIPLNDGTLRFLHGDAQSKKAVFDSVDNGVTWTKNETDIIQTDGYVNIFRLNNGSLMQIVNKTINGTVYRVSQTSTDEGKTWTDGGVLCVRKYETDDDGNSVGPYWACTMNDRITQTSTGRIFYSQGYEGKGSSDTYNVVYSEIYYSDDNGATWSKSENRAESGLGYIQDGRYGELKVLECSDGALRYYCTQNLTGYMIYSESTDNGATWGDVVEMTEFPCASSSMQFVRDPYADNDTTYYMVWCNSKPAKQDRNPRDAQTRARLTVAKSTDGKNWTTLGDIWRWESGYEVNNTGGAILSHIVNPFIQVTDTHIIVGTGLSEHLPVTESDRSIYHGAQRQHIWSIPRTSLIVDDETEDSPTESSEPTVQETSTDKSDKVNNSIINKEDKTESTNPVKVEEYIVNNSKMPGTGDETNIIPFVSLAIITFTSFVIIRKIKRNRN